MADLLPAAVVVAGALWVLATRSLRLASLGLLAQFAAASVLTSGVATRGELALSGTAALSSVVILYLAAGEAHFGEEPGWRVWPAVTIAAASTTLAFIVFASPDVERYLQLSTFWLLSVGLGVLLAARTPSRAVLGTLLMLSGTQLALHFDATPHLGVTIVFSWVELVVTLVGAFLIVEERSLAETL